MLIESQIAQLVNKCAAAHLSIYVKLSVMWSDPLKAASSLRLRLVHSTLIYGYNDSSQSRIVPSFAHGVRDLRDTGLTFAMALRFISRSTFA